ncbi:MAG: amidohydrolase family protein [Candidatus Eremiobacteraeota bacterium]|nr:amidohydrolase family protein [Candidatus Eremiobacteraeota bacterium]MBC5827091.1 amidohydrolase family protein [Candidatus Eremiobacteraeota bacterium]
MSSRTIGPALLAFGDGTSHQGCLRVEDGRIAATEDGPQYIDYELPFGSTVSPGLIDLHVNGIARYWFNREPVETVRAVALAAPKRGVTAFLPSIMTAPWEQMLYAADEVYRCVNRPPSGARPLGVHFEGPFLNPKFGRVHPREYILEPTPARIEALLKTWAGGRCRVTMAPEIDEAPGAAAELKRHGVTLAAGHTGADFAAGNAAIEQGYHLLTHAFNAMPPLAGRGSSILHAFLLEPTVMCEVIADNIHVSPESIALLYRLKTINLVLTTDVMPLVEGLVDEGGVARTKEGVIAGSLLTPDRAVRNLMAATGLPLAEAVTCGTWAPARAIGVADEIGSLKVGMRADLAVWDRHNRITHAFVAGELVYADS